MKKLLAVVLVAFFIFALAACDDIGEHVKNNNKINTPTQSANDSTQSQNNQTDSNIITRERAIELALAHAGLTEAQVYDLEAELDRERGGTYWEVDFENGTYEYSYDINAQTEEIRRLEKERD